jgi:serine/threonine protein kinase
MVHQRWANTAYAVEHGGLTAARLRDFGSQLVTGLAFIHSRDIIHRDLKCGNVLVAEGAPGRLLLKISDLGISKDVPGGADAASGPHTNIGTPKYKAPEVHGSARPAYSGRADIYSLGLVLTDVASQELWYVRLGRQEMMHDHRTMPCMQCLDDAVRAAATASPHLAVLADGMLRIPTGERMKLAAAAEICASEPSPLPNHVAAAEALLRQGPLPPPSSCISAVQTLSRLSVAAGMEEQAVSCLAQLLSQSTNSAADPDTLTAVVQALSSLAVQKTELTRHAAWLPAVLDVAANKRVAEDVRIIAVNTLDVLTWDEAESMEVLLPSTGEEMGVMSAALLLTKLRHDPFSRVSVAADRVMKCWQ